MRFVQNNHLNYWLTILKWELESNVQRSAMSSKARAETSEFH